jgi:deoxycytidylate deaminase
MAAPSVAVKPPPHAETESVEGTIERLKKTHTNELVFALCGPIGSPLHLVAEKITETLSSKFQYECETIRLSDFILEHGAPVPQTANTFERVNHLVAEGNKLRATHGKGVLAELGIAKIHLKRQGIKLKAGSERFTPQRFCHIFDSIKNQQELDVLRLVYGDLLYCIGIFSPLPFREDGLKSRGLKQGQIYQLIDQDSGEEFEHGQTVSDTFPQADFFLKVDSKATGQIEEKVERLLNLITGLRIGTPTSHEIAMYTAASAAAKSACLSRQVGASITDSRGQILGVGWNDVPKYGGGLYESSDSGRGDHRCMNMEDGKCFNDDEKNKIAAQIASDLISAELITEQQRSTVVATIRQSKIRELIEFSRAVHAEVHAIINAAQATGTQMRGGRLYCTTSPCHSCARHIIAAGIEDVFFIEPYRKSMATALHGDAITENESLADRVHLLPFEGVAPRRFHSIFAMRPNSRKKDGRMVTQKPATVGLPMPISLESFPVLEGKIALQLVEKNLIKASETAV